MPKLGQQCTPEQIEQIVELCLDRVPVREIASRVGCNKDTVTKHWHRWLDESTETRRAEMERKRSEVIARLDSTAAKARKGWVQAGFMDDASDASKAQARFLAEERQALIGLARVAGYDAPIQVSGRVELSDDEAREALRKLPARSRQRLGLG